MPILAPTAQACACSPVRDQRQLPALPADSVLACSVVLAAPGHATGSLSRAQIQQPAVPALPALPADTVLDVQGGKALCCPGAT